MFSRKLSDRYFDSSIVCDPVQTRFDDSKKNRTYFSKILISN